MVTIYAINTPTQANKGNNIYMYYALQTLLHRQTMVTMYVLSPFLNRPTMVTLYVLSPFSNRPTMVTLYVLYVLSTLLHKPTNICLAAQTLMLLTQSDA